MKVTFADWRDIYVRGVDANERAAKALTDKLKPNVEKTLRGSRPDS